MRLSDAQAVYDRYPALKSDGVIYASVAHVIQELEQQLAQATERERIAAAAYDGQQSSQRELEALYQAATERAERMERVAMSLLPLCEGLHEALEAGDTWNARARSNARDSLAKAIVAAKVGML